MSNISNTSNSPDRMCNDDFLPYPMIRQQAFGYMTEEDTVLHYIKRFYSNEQEIRELKNIIEKQDAIIKELREQLQAKKQ